MTAIERTIEEIHALFVHRLYLSCVCDTRRAGDTVDRFIALLIEQENALIRESEEALRKDLELEILIASSLSKLKRLELYLRGPRWVVATRLYELTN